MESSQFERHTLKQRSLQPFYMLESIPSKGLTSNSCWLECSINPRRRHLLHDNLLQFAGAAGGGVARLRNVLDADKIPLLQPIFKNHGGLIIQQARGKDRQYARVWIAQGLARPIDIEKPHRHGRDPIRPPHHQAHTLLVEFR